MTNSLVPSRFSILETQPTQVVMNPGSTESPPAWMRYGTSPTEIILAVAVVIKVLVPVMQYNPSRKRK